MRQGPCTRHVRIPACYISCQLSKWSSLKRVTKASAHAAAHRSRHERSYAVCGAADSADRMPDRRPYSSATIATPPTTAATTAKEAADAAQDRPAASCCTCSCCTAASTLRSLKAEWRRVAVVPKYGRQTTLAENVGQHGAAVRRKRSGRDRAGKTAPAGQLSQLCS